MRSIVFSNYVAKDTRRLGATIDVEHSHVKFLGNLTLNLWDCGGQDAFMENYLAHQRDHVFSQVAVLIYVFDIESREFERDLVVYSSVLAALKEHSGPPSSSNGSDSATNGNTTGARVFALVHKMDLVQAAYRDQLFQERSRQIRDRSAGFETDCFATSIWDETLYKAWASIIYTLIPNLSIIESYLRRFTDIISASEVVLFERTTFLVVCHVTSTAILNPNNDRFERISNIIKTFKHSLARFTASPKSASQFDNFELKVPSFGLFVDRLTSNTYILVVVGPGEARLNAAKMNVRIAKRDFERLDVTGEASRKSFSNQQQQRLGPPARNSRRSERPQISDDEDDDDEMLNDDDGLHGQY
jgi:Ras-related GTP-binding protein A/B